MVTYWKVADTKDKTIRVECQSEQSLDGRSSRSLQNSIRAVRQPEVGDNTFLVSTNHGAGFPSRVGAAAYLTMGRVTGEGERDLVTADGGMTLDCSWIPLFPIMRLGV